MQIPIVEWFNPKNEEHRAAYQTLMDTGKWPEECPPADVYLNCGWETTIHRIFSRKLKSVEPVV